MPSCIPKKTKRIRKKTLTEQPPATLRNLLPRQNGRVSLSHQRNVDDGASPREGPLS